MKVLLKEFGISGQISCLSLTLDPRPSTLDPRPSTLDPRQKDRLSTNTRSSGIINKLVPRALVSFAFKM